MCIIIYTCIGRLPSFHAYIFQCMYMYLYNREHAIQKILTETLISMQKHVTKHRVFQPVLFQVAMATRTTEYSSPECFWGELVVCLVYAHRIISKKY